jgi:hypothetical protein
VQQHKTQRLSDRREAVKLEEGTGALAVAALSPSALNQVSGAIIDVLGCGITAGQPLGDGNSDSEHGRGRTASESDADSTANTMTSVLANLDTSPGPFTVAPLTGHETPTTLALTGQAVQQLGRLATGSLLVATGGIQARTSALVVTNDRSAAPVTAPPPGPSSVSSPQMAIIAHTKAPPVRPQEATSLPTPPSASRPPSVEQKSGEQGPASAQLSAASASPPAPHSASYPAASAQVSSGQGSGNVQPSGVVPSIVPRADPAVGQPGGVMVPPVNPVARPAAAAPASAFAEDARAVAHALGHDCSESDESQEEARAVARAHAHYAYEKIAARPGAYQAEYSSDGSPALSPTFGTPSPIEERVD